MLHFDSHYFFLFICRVLVHVLLVVPYYMVSKDEYKKLRIRYVTSSLFCVSNAIKYTNKNIIILM